MTNQTQLQFYRQRCVLGTPKSKVRDQQWQQLYKNVSDSGTQGTPPSKKNTSLGIVQNTSYNKNYFCVYDGKKYQ